jgi:hypothetical protein
LNQNPAPDKKDISSCAGWRNGNGKGGWVKKGMLLAVTLTKDPNRVQFGGVDYKKEDLYSTTQTMNGGKADAVLYCHSRFVSLPVHRGKNDASGNFR